MPRKKPRKNFVDVNSPEYKEKSRKTTEAAYRLARAATEITWAVPVKPSLKGSGALPPNPKFDHSKPDVPTPYIDALIEAFSTPVDLDRFPSWP